MPAHYVPLRALRRACRWMAERATPLLSPVVVSLPEPLRHGVITLMKRN